MLGKQVYEGRAKVVGMRVLENGKVEYTYAMQGLFLGEEFSAMWTNENEMRPDGTMSIEAWGFFNAKDGTSGRYKIIGNGVMRPDGTGVGRGVVCYHCPPGKFAYLNGISVVWENEWDKDFNMQSKGWEWK